MAASVDDPAALDARGVEDLEIDLLLEGVFRRFGHDFRGYRREPLRERLHALMRDAGLRTVSALQERVMHDPAMDETLLRAFCARPAALFEDPDYFLALRTAIVPWLRSCPSPRIWIAECVSAEEACTLAILLEEERLYEKTQIFVTAASETLLEEARQGGFPLDRLAQYEDNYRRSGGGRSLADYCGVRDGRGVFGENLRRNLIWAQYSLATDASFNEFQLILCRRTLSDFGPQMQHRVLQLFHDSLPLFGILAVDRKEPLAIAPFTTLYKRVSEEQGLYRRVL